MPLLSSNQFKDCIKNIIHEDTQLHKKSIDLTVDSIHQFTSAGSLDFGGSEFEPAKSQLLTPKKQNGDDEYGWWKLARGAYKAVFNEELSLTDNQFAFIMLHNHARKAGLTGTSSFVIQNEGINFTFRVPECGCNIKENARIATAFFMKI